MPESHIVTCFLRHRGEVLLDRRDEGSDCYPGRWDAVAGRVKDDPDETAHEVIQARSGSENAVALVRTGDPFIVENSDSETRWILRPFLFECDSRAVDPDDDSIEFEWVPPTEIRRRETVPGLRRAYERVAPTVNSVQTDTEHGSAWLSVSALSVLRNRAGGLATNDDPNGEEWDDLVALATDLRTVRPSMAVVGNRINRVMAAASDERTAEAVERAAIAGIDRAFEADTGAAREAADLLSGTVVTLSRSGTVLDALRETTEVSLIVGESRPDCEGVGVAEALVADHRVTLTVDAALPHLLATRSIGCALVGADTVLPDGSVVNKVGTRGLAVAAAHERIPVYAVTATDKIAIDDTPDFEDGPREAVYDGDEALDVANPTFDRTPPEFVTVVTEDGPLEPDEIADRADELAAFADRAKDTSSDPE